MQGRRLLFNTLLVSMVSIGLRLLGLGFQVWFSRRMGAAGLGVFQLILSAYGFAATLAIAGIRFATTRVVAEEVGRASGGSLAAVRRRSLQYACAAGLFAGALLFLAAHPLAARLLRHPEAALSLRILAAGLPFLAPGAALGGYFTGRAQAGKASLVSLAEEVTRVAVSLLLLRRVTGGEVGLLCAAAAGGIAAGEAVSLFAALLLCAGERLPRPPARENVLPRLTAIAFPLALAACARTALSALLNLLVPWGLERSGASPEAALAGYGTIQGMVLPLVSFPQLIFAALAELVVPELTEEQVQGNAGRIERSAALLGRLCILFSLGVMGALLTFSRELGLWFYQSEEVGRTIGAFALLMPLMYLDTVTDGMLRGLGEHLFVMRLNLVDSVLCVALAALLLPRYGLAAYVLLLYLSELFNFALSLRRLSGLVRLAGLTAALPPGLLAALGAGNLARALLRLAPSPLPALAAYCAVYTALTLLLHNFHPYPLAFFRRK